MAGFNKRIEEELNDRLRHEFNENKVIDRIVGHVFFRNGKPMTTTTEQERDARYFDSTSAFMLNQLQPHKQ